MPAWSRTQSPSGKTSALFLAGSGVLMCALVIAATCWIIYQQKQTAIESAGADLQNVSRAAAAQVDRAISSLKRAQGKLIYHMALPSDDSISALASATFGKPLYDVMQDLVASTDEVYSFAVVDVDGRVVLSSRHWPAPNMDVRDRDYFENARSHPEVTDAVSDAIVGKVTGLPTFALTHTFRKPDGSFAGLLVSYVQVGYLEHLFSTNTLQHSFTTTLLREDGVILAHYPEIVVKPDPQRDSRFLAMIAQAGDHPFRHMGVFTTKERLFATTRVNRRPFIVIVSQPFDQAIAPWNGQALAAVLLGLVGCLATSTTVSLAMYKVSVQRRLQVAQLSEVKAEQHARYGVALDNMSQALLMYDRNNRLLLSNAAASDMFGLEEGELRPGMSPVQVLARILRKERVSETDVEFRFFTDLISQPRRTSFTHKMSDGRTLVGHFAPIDEGWLLTFEDNTEIQTTNDRIKHMALHDALTSQPNRVQFWSRTDDALKTMGDGSEVAVLYLDLDDFKGVNDTLGHPAGDKLLCAASQRIDAEIRSTDVVARLGGDEFAILVSPARDMAFVSDLADRLVEAVSEPYSIEGQMVKVGVSIGIAVAPKDGTDPDTLMKNADMALYSAKRGGRGRYRVFDHSMWQQTVDRRRLERELHEGLLNGEFELFYQPIVQVRTRTIVCFEALIRWRHPTRELISPLQFISVAEENGSIVEIGAWTLNQACREAIRWPDHVKVAVNLSPVQFRGGSLVGIVENALAVSGLTADRLELEITESTMMQDTDATLSTLQALKALGVRIAMDDFGTGYSSLAYLQKFPFDKVKIDRAFVRDIGSPSSLAIVRAVTGITASLGIDTLAEGVETEDQFRSVANERCDEAQGFLFSVPCPASFVGELFAAEERRRNTMQSFSLAVD